ncbi:MAG: hypothetical protein ACLR0U_18590 [Enterocloster clostridioformis]
MAAAKAYKKKPIDIASQVVEQLVSGGSHPVFSEAEAVMPGFINPEAVDCVSGRVCGGHGSADKLGLEAPERPETAIVDYGGAMGKAPLTGAICGRPLSGEHKAHGPFLGHHMIGDVHLGDWGLQMGLIIEELKDRKPELVYFDESFEGPFPQEAPFTIRSWRIYPRPALSPRWMRR